MLAAALAGWLGADPARAHDGATEGAEAADAVVVVRARLRDEDPQTIPVAVTALGAEELRRAGVVGTAGIAQLVPSLAYASANPRNTSVSIRGLGSSVVAIAQANDGLEAGVGLYVDGVYRGRPAAGAFNFADLEQVDVLRGPQGTLFGRNTTAGAVVLTSRRPSFTPGWTLDASAGGLGYLQVRATATGPVAGELVAGRVSVAHTQRAGILSNATTGDLDNSLGNTVLRASLLVDPPGPWQGGLIADSSAIRSVCCTQVFVRVGTTRRPAARQFPAMAAALGYIPASTDPHHRLSDVDAQVRLETDDGGMTATAERLGEAVRFTSISAWRWWNWDVDNDRDFTALPIQTLQRIPSRQDQWSQELRLAGEGERLDWVAGLYGFRQTITGNLVTEYGPRATFWLLGPAPTYAPGLLDGYRLTGRTRFTSTSFAAFGEATWAASETVSLTLGLRHTWEDKDGTYASSVSGGATPRTPVEAAGKLSILRGQAYSAAVTDSSLTGRASVAWRPVPAILAYLQVASAEKSGGINMSGLPLDAAGQPALATAVIRPERTLALEAGLKTDWFDRRLIVNLAVYRTRVHDFQTNIVDAAPGALRGYLANIDEVLVDGAELDASWHADATTARLSLAWTDARYGRFPNGGCPLEEIVGGTQVCDLSGRSLAGIPEWAVSGGIDRAWPLGSGGLEGFARLDASWRSETAGEATGSRFTRIDAYGLASLSAGLRSPDGWEVSFFVRNLTDTGYLTNVTVQAGNSGLVVGTPGEPRLIGLSVRVEG